MTVKVEPPVCSRSWGWSDGPGLCPWGASYLVMEGRVTMTKKINKKIQGQEENTTGECAPECWGERVGHLKSMKVTNELRPG